MTNGTTLYGIRNCDTVKKARAWLDTNGVGYDFHDYKTAGVPADRLAGWVDEMGWEALLNRAGTTFRALPDVEREGLDRDRALAIMTAHPASIRRPVLDTGAARVVGFKPDQYAILFGSAEE